MPRIERIFTYGTGPWAGRLEETRVPSSTLRPAAPMPEARVPPQVDLPPRHFRPDPTVMFGSSPFVGEPYRGAKPALEAVARKLNAGSVSIGGHWALIERWIQPEDRAYAKRLCRVLNPAAWPTIFAAFVDAVVRGRLSRPEKWEARDQRLPPGWSRDPWFYISVDRLARSRFRLEGPYPSTNPGIQWVRDMGFLNMALLDAFGEGHLFSEDRGTFEEVIDIARQLGMRVAVRAEHTVEFPNVKATKLDPYGDPVFIAHALQLVAREVNLGVLGIRLPTGVLDVASSSRIKVRGPSFQEREHAFHALLKLYARLIGPKEVVIPELARHGSSDQKVLGGQVILNNEATSAEGDTLHWHEGMMGLRAALSLRSKRVIERELRLVPEVLNNVTLMVSLDYHIRSYLDPVSQSSEPLSKLLRGNNRRIATALAMLYIMPATPVVYDQVELGVDPFPLLLRSLNRLRMRTGPIERREFQVVPVPHDDLVVWAVNKMGFGFLLVANLGRVRVVDQLLFVDPAEPRPYALRPGVLSPVSTLQVGKLDVRADEKNAVVFEAEAESVGLFAWGDLAPFEAPTDPGFSLKEIEW
jgi:hypothetical protein